MSESRNHSQRWRLSNARDRLLRLRAALYDRVRSAIRAMWATVSNGTNDLGKHKWMPESSALGPATWMAGLLLTALVTLSKVGTSEWLLRCFFALVAAYVVNYGGLYWYFAKCDRDQLRPASHALEKYRIDNANVGDSRHGVKKATESSAKRSGKKVKEAPSKDAADA